MTEKTARRRGMATIIADIIYKQLNIEKIFDNWAIRAWKAYEIEPFFLACDVATEIKHKLTLHAEELEKKLKVSQE